MPHVMDIIRDKAYYSRQGDISESQPLIFHMSLKKKLTTSSSFTENFKVTKHSGHLLLL